MDLTMWENVLRDFSKVAGRPKSKPKAAAMTRFRWCGQYLIYNESMRYQFLIGLGYFVEQWRNADYPHAGILIEIAHSLDPEKTIDTFLSQQSSHNGISWEQHRGKDRTAYYLIKPLNSLLQGTDHVADITGYFTGLVDYIDKMRCSSEKDGIPIPWRDRVIDPDKVKPEESDDTGDVDD
jgi:hypothetical protein